MAQDCGSYRDFHDNPSPGVRDVLEFYRPAFERMQEGTSDPEKLPRQAFYWQQFVEFQKQTAERIFLTPELATKLLDESNRKFLNRKVKPKQVKKLMRKIMSDRYKPTHQAIAITTENYMCDGQHRALAVQGTGIGVAIWLVRNVPPDAIAAIDRGAGRTAAQDLHMRGDSAADDKLRLLRRMLELLGFDSTTVTDDEEYDKWMPLFGESIEFILPYLERAERCVKNAPVMGAIAFAYPKNKRLVTEFAEQVVTGDMIQQGDPAHTLRRYCNSHSIKGQQARSEFSRATLQSLKALFDGNKIVELKHSAVSGSLYFRAYYRKHFHSTLEAHAADMRANAFDGKPKKQKKKK